MPTRLDDFRAYRLKMNEIVIPHLRHAVETLDLARQEPKAASPA